MKKYQGYIFTVLVILLTLKVFIPQLDGLRESIKSLNGANYYWIAFGTLVFFLGIPILALQYKTLALKPLKYRLTFNVEMAGQFVSKLLPSSLGTLSLNMYYLIKVNHTPSQATAVMSINAMLSGLAYLCLIILALSLSSLSLNGMDQSVNLPDNLMWFLILLVLGTAFVLYRYANLRNRIKNIWRDTKKSLKSFKQRPKVLAIGFVCNGLGSFTSLFAIYASAYALDVHITIADALLAYTFANIAAALIPTPGGIGSAEAGIYSGLVLVGVDGPDAILITFLYRLISYWLPIIPGYYYFLGLRKNILADYSFKKRYAE